MRMTFTPASDEAAAQEGLMRMVVCPLCDSPAVPRPGAASAAPHRRNTPMPDTCTCPAGGDVTSAIDLCEICGQCETCCGTITADCGHTLSPAHDDPPRATVTAVRAAASALRGMCTPSPPTHREKKAMQRPVIINEGIHSYSVYGARVLASDFLWEPQRTKGRS